MSHNPNNHNNYNSFVNDDARPEVRKPSAYHDEEIFHSDSESHLDFYDNPNERDFDQPPMHKTFSDPFKSELNTNYSNTNSEHQSQQKSAYNVVNNQVEPEYFHQNTENNEYIHQNQVIPNIEVANQYQQNERQHPYPNQMDFGQTHVPSSPFEDLEMGKMHTYDDNESIILDLQGDEYPINSFLRKNGTMSNPYRDNKFYHDVWIRNEGPHMASDPFQQVADQHIQMDYNKELDPIDEYFDDDEEKHGDLSSMDKEVQFTSSFEDLAEKETDLKDEDNQEQKTVPRRFILENGNFVFDCPIGSSLLNQYYKSFDNSQNMSNEFKFMRYQAVTCQPHEFSYKNFVLRQQKFMIPRVTELMIVITMYNEDDFLLGRTLKGVFENIRHMLKKTRSKTWGPDAWKKIVVTVVSDGRSKINPRAQALMSALGCYQDGFAKSEINGEEVLAHLYEHTSKVNISGINDDGTVDLKCDQTSIPVQFLFCLKEQNQKKINSHRWAIEAFAESLNPNVICLLDAGTMPGKTSIYNLWREFKNPRVGGACGEIKVDIGNFGKHLLNPLVASQNFEYKMSNILDKTTESCFGYISVLPGAFSAYRYQALLGKPLRKYFHGEDENIQMFESNMYLAEDRVLCYEIVTKDDFNWILKYCKDSFASTDVPDKIPEFILQRRRWMNGSFFAALYSFIHFPKIWSSGHSIVRKLFLTIEILYMMFQTLVSWFSLSSFFLVFRILTLSLSVTFPDVAAFNYLAVVFLWIYGFTVLATFILSLGNRPQGTHMFYLIVFVFFAILMIYTIFAAVYLSVHTVKDLVDEQTKVTFKTLLLKSQFRDLLISMGSTYVLYIFSSIIYLQPWHMLTSFVQYLLISPSYINVLNIYAFANLHDVTWGTKGAVKGKFLGSVQAKKDGTVQTEIPIHAAEIDANYRKYAYMISTKQQEETTQEKNMDEAKQSYYATVRSIVLILWATTNFAVVSVILNVGGYAEYNAIKKGHSNDYSQKVQVVGPRARVYFAIILWVVAFLAAIRAMGCMLYLIQKFILRFRKK